MLVFPSLDLCCMLVSLLFFSTWIFPFHSPVEFNLLHLVPFIFILPLMCVFFYYLPFFSAFLRPWPTVYKSVRSSYILITMRRCCLALGSCFHLFCPANWLVMHVWNLDAIFFPFAYCLCLLPLPIIFPPLDVQLIELVTHGCKSQRFWCCFFFLIFMF